MLKLEPREADRIPVPGLNFIIERETKLEAIRPHVAKAVAKGQVAEALKLVDSVLWDADAAAQAILTTLRDAREFLFQRRHQRSRSSAHE
jgi:hypothetical protein